MITTFGALIERMEKEYAIVERNNQYSKIQENIKQREVGFWDGRSMQLRNILKDIDPSLLTKDYKVK